MPPKKGGKKKVEEPPAPSEFDEFSIAQLKQTLQELRAETEHTAKQRAQAQVDRDAIESFFEVTRKEVKEVELGLLAKEREIETAAENHRVEVKVYTQKVKHLEYEHVHSMKRQATEDSAVLRTGEEVHEKREAALRAEKSALRARIADMELASAEAVEHMRTSHEKTVSKLQQEFTANLEQLRTKYETRLQQLREDLRLRLKVEVHEVEERKNLHINQLMRAHEEAFGEMKKYYNDVTRANLELISELKLQIQEATEKQTANQKLMMEIAEENKRLSDPLQRAQAELESLKVDLKDATKDKQSLIYARARIKVLKANLTAMRQRQQELETGYETTQQERDELYSRFETMVRAAQATSESRNAALEHKLAEAEHEYMTRRAQVSEVMSAAQLDPTILETVGSQLDAVLESRNTMLRDMQVAVGALTKAHNDAVRVLDAKLRSLGIPAEETARPLLPTAVGVGPAGLVAKPSM